MAEVTLSTGAVRIKAGFSTLSTDFNLFSNLNSATPHAPRKVLIRRLITQRKVKGPFQVRLFVDSATGHAYNRQALRLEGRPERRNEVEANIPTKHQKAQ